MRVEVMEHYGLTQSIEQAGYYETAHHKQLMKDIKGAIREGRLIAVCGVVGSGKTVTLRRLQQQLLDENKIIVARSLSVDKQSVRLATLINALFYDLAQDKQVQIPKQGERRERELQELVKKGKRPVALFVDEAHDLNGNTLTGLKRLMEVVEDGGGRLSVVLAGHPKLRNDLRRPTMEEIGYRTDIFTLDGITGSQREYIQWLLKTSTGKGKPEDILTTEAVDLLAMKLRTVKIKYINNDNVLYANHWAIPDEAPVEVLAVVDRRFIFPEPPAPPKLSLIQKLSRRFFTEDIAETSRINFQRLNSANINVLKGRGSLSSKNQRSIYLRFDAVNADALRPDEIYIKNNQFDDGGYDRYFYNNMVGEDGSPTLNTYTGEILTDPPSFSIVVGVRHTG